MASALVLALIATLFSLIPLSLIPAPAAMAQTSSVVISEIFYNPDGQAEGHEFVKLANVTGSPVDLSGWEFISGIEYTFPAGTSLPASGFLVLANTVADFSVVFPGVAASEFTGALSNGGETLTLTDASGAVADTVTYSDAPPWPTSADGSGDSLQLLDPASDNALAVNWVAGQPSPGATNNPNLDVRFSLTRGWYSGTQQVTLTSTIPGATIRYATGAGAVGTTYTGPITLTDNNDIRVIRAQATSGGSQSGIVTHTYVFKNDTGNVTPLVAIWPNPVPVAPGESEQTVHVEFLPPPSIPLSPVAGYAGFKASDQGVSGGESDKLFFRGVYGDSTLNGDLFSDRDYAFPVATEYDQLFLRDLHLDNTHLRQIMAHDAMLAAGQLAPHGRFVEYHVNGTDQGIRHLQERPEGGFMESYTDIDKSQWVAWSGDEQDPTYGLSTFGAPYNSWAQANQIVNVEHLIDSLLVQWQANVADFRGPKNYRAAGPNNPNAGDGNDYRFHFFNWDMDLGYGRSYNLGSYPGDGPTGWRWSAVVSGEYLAHELDHLPEFRLLASDRITCAHFNGGSLTAGAVNARLVDRNAEYVRAGGSSQTTFLNKMSSWIGDRNQWLIGQYRRNSHSNTIYGTTVRPNSPPNQATTTFQGPLFPESNPLSLSESNGLLTVSGSASGTIYYRLDGGDPRTANGQVDPAALIYTGPVPLPAGRHEVIARAFNSSASDIVDRWSPACNDAQIIDVAIGGGAIVGTGLVMNELHYNPTPGAVTNNDEFEFMELVNTSGVAINLGGMYFGEGIDFTFPLGATLLPGELVVLASNAAEFSNRYGFAPDHQYGGKMANSGDRLVLLNAQGQQLDVVEYDDLAPWPTNPDGLGPSLSLVDASLDNSLASSWTASSDAGGSPGQANATYVPGDADCDGALTINDAAVIARYSVGLLNSAPTCAQVAGPTDISLQGGDSNGDGQVIILDAYNVAQCVVGLTNSLCP